MPEQLNIDAETIARDLGRARRSGSGSWTCCCPAHDDREPSLSVTDTGDSKVLVHCHAGCDQDAVIKALRDRGLWPDSTTRDHTKRDKGLDPAGIGWTPILPVPHGAPKPRFDHPKLGKRSLKWEYRDEDDELLGYMHRFETPDGGKTFRPLTYCENQNGERKWRQQGFSKPLPLYGLQRLAAQPGAPVVIAEGEKAADCAGQLLMQMVAVSWPHGAKSVAEVDWGPLAGRQVYVWPDADDEGHRAGQEIARRCLEAGAASIHVIRPPSGVPKSWDAADALSEDYPAEKISMLISEAETATLGREIHPGQGINLAHWRADRFNGPPPERQWLVRGVLPLATPTMLAATGGTGKSMLMLKLALEVSTGELTDRQHDHPDLILGGEVSCHGSAVLITAEDDKGEVHRRLHALDPDGIRLHNPVRLVVVPLPNAGGILTLLRGGFDSPQITDEYEALYKQLTAIRDLRLIVFDPLQAFVGADANKDPAAGQYFCTLLGQLAADTGATVVVTHHFRKQGKIRGPADAREAVRGTTALIDGMRCVYALWPTEEKHAKKACSELGVKYEPNKVIRGAVVKANWPVEMKVETYVRNDAGLLCDHTDRLAKSVEDRDALLSRLEEAIGQAALDGKPYTKTGKNGVYNRREELPSNLRKIGRNRLQDMVQELLNADRARQCSAGKSGTVQWLDLPGGSFDLGEGAFAPGALKSRR